MQSPVQALGLGMLWGWLPCGMVYAMLLTALASGNATEGGLIMAAFALGTLPNLLLIGAAWSSFLRWMSVGWVRRLASAAVAIVGLYGILHVLQPSALDPDSLLCRSWPGLAEWLRP
jgi:sulfite exporter TauE/SafE